MAEPVYLPDWPRVARAHDPALEADVAAILARMTLEEKIGQMIQPELAELTPEDVRAYKIGSALNGAGIWPGGYATIPASRIGGCRLLLLTNPAPKSTESRSIPLSPRPASPDLSWTPETSVPAELHSTFGPRNVLSTIFKRRSCVAPLRPFAACADLLRTGRA
jgi:hypothetical protein